MATRIATVKLQSMSPMSQGKYHETPKKNKETHADYEERTWSEKLHYDKDGNVFIPPFALKNCLSEGAKFLSIQIPGKGKSTYTKHFEAGVLVTEPVNLKIHKDKIQAQWIFVPADGVRGSGKRVNKAFPVIPEWKGIAKFYIFDDIITEEIFEKVLVECGKFIGLGSLRVRNNGIWGRFDVKGIKWTSEE